MNTAPTAKKFVEDQRYTFTLVKLLTGIVILMFILASVVGLLIVKELRNLAQVREITISNMNREMQEVKDNLKYETEKTMMWRKHVDDYLKKMQTLYEKSLQKNNEQDN